MDKLNNDNQTDQKETNNSDRNEKDELFLLVRPLWQGHEESNLDLRFWRPLY